MATKPNKNKPKSKTQRRIEAKARGAAQHLGFPLPDVIQALTFEIVRMREQLQELSKHVLATKPISAPKQLLTEPAPYPEHTTGVLLEGTRGDV